MPYYNKVQIISLLKSKFKRVGPYDVEVTNSAKGAILRAVSGERIRMRADMVSGEPTHQEEIVT